MVLKNFGLMCEEQKSRNPPENRMSERLALIFAEGGKKISRILMFRTDIGLKV